MGALNGDTMPDGGMEGDDMEPDLMPGSGTPMPNQKKKKPTLAEAMAEAMNNVAKKKRKPVGRVVDPTADQQPPGANPYGP